MSRTSKRKRQKSRKQSDKLPAIRANIPEEKLDDLQGFELPPELHGELQGTVRQLHIKRERHIAKKEFKGPLPSPEIFAQYREINPELPDIIVSEWQKEGETRRKCARSYGNREWGRIAIVGIFALGMLAISGWLTYKEQYQYAVAVLLSPFAVRLIAALFGGSK